MDRYLWLTIICLIMNSLQFFKRKEICPQRRDRDFDRTSLRVCGRALIEQSDYDPLYNILIQHVSRQFCVHSPFCSSVLLSPWDSYWRQFSRRAFWAMSYAFRTLISSGRGNGYNYTLCFISFCFTFFTSSICVRFCRIVSEEHTLSSSWDACSRSRPSSHKTSHRNLDQ